MPYYFYMCDMIPFSRALAGRGAGAQELQHGIMGYLPGFATPRIVCDVPYVGKRWVHQLQEYDRERGISYWTKNYRTGIETDDPEALNRTYEYYDPIDTLPAEGQQWWTATHGDGVDEASPAQPRPWHGVLSVRVRSSGGAVLVRGGQHDRRAGRHVRLGADLGQQQLEGRRCPPPAP